MYCFRGHNLEIAHARYRLVVYLSQYSSLAKQFGDFYGGFKLLLLATLQLA